MKRLRCPRTYDAPAHAVLAQAFNIYIYSVVLVRVRPCIQDKQRGGPPDRCDGGCEEETSPERFCSSPLPTRLGSRACFDIGEMPCDHRCFFCSRTCPL